MDIITTIDLAAYLAIYGIAAPAPAVATLAVELANSVVSQAWTVQTDPAPAWVKALTLEVAARPFRNPGGIASRTVTVDDASRTERFGADAVRVGVFLTDAELAMLQPTTGASAGSLPYTTSRSPR